MNTSTPQKACPFCAETLKADAIVCRYCQRDLPTALSPKESRLVPCDNCGGEILTSFKRQTEGFCRNCATAAGIPFDSSATDVPVYVPPVLVEVEDLESGPQAHKQSKPVTTFFAAVGFCTFCFFSLITLGCVSILAKAGNSSSGPRSAYTSIVKGGPNDLEWEARRFVNQYSKTPNGQVLDARRRRRERQLERNMTDEQKLERDLRYSNIPEHQKEFLRQQLRDGVPY